MRPLRARHVDTSSGRSPAVCSSAVPVSRRVAERPVPLSKICLCEVSAECLEKWANQPVDIISSLRDCTGAESRTPRRPEAGGQHPPGGLTGLRPEAKHMPAPLPGRHQALLLPGLPRLLHVTSSHLPGRSLTPSIRVLLRIPTQYFSLHTC
jgi:hypothetical protein